MIEFKIETNVVKIDTPTRIGVMVEVTAPEVALNTSVVRNPRGLVFVVDRSGSMGGGRLELVKDNILEIIGRLHKTDFVSLVAFDNNVDVTIPMSRVGDLDIAQVRKQIADLQPGGNTNLEQGYRYGLAEAANVPSGVEVQLLLLSDGQANAGSCDPAELGQLAAAATEHLVATTTLGIGKGYDENILVQMANTGNGNHFAAVDYQEAATGLQTEIDDLLTRAVSDLKIQVIRKGQFADKCVVRDVQRSRGTFFKEHSTIYSIGSLGSQEERNFVYELDFQGVTPEYSELAGTVEIEVTYTDETTGQTVVESREFELYLIQHENWMEPARDEDIVMELATLRAQDAKEEAIRLMRAGREAEARELILTVGASLEDLEQEFRFMSTRNRGRARASRSEFAEMSEMQADEFIKRGEESLKRGRESKQDPRKRNQGDA